MDVLKFNLKDIIYKTKDKKYEKMVGKHLKIYISQRDHDSLYFFDYLVYWMSLWLK